MMEWLEGEEEWKLVWKNIGEEWQWQTINGYLEQIDAKIVEFGLQIEAVIVMWRKNNE